MNCYNIVREAVERKTPFIIHRHHPRNGSLHYDLRFMDNKDSKLLHSFAAPKDFMDTLDTKTVLAKTRDHDPRWLTLKSYRLDTIDSGEVKIKVSTKKYFELQFFGKKIKGTYKLFKLNTKREDRWLLIKKG